MSARPRSLSGLVFGALAVLAAVAWVGPYVWMLATSLRPLAEIVARDQLTLRALHHEVDRLRYEAGLAPPLTVPVTADLRARTQVRPHALSTYDRLHTGRGDADEDR